MTDRPHRIAYTSIAAYRESVLDGTVTAQHGKIMRVLYQYHGLGDVSLNRRQISELTGLEINAVTGRVRSLIDSELIEVKYEKKDPLTDRKVEYLSPIMPPPEQRQRKLAL